MSKVFSIWGWIPSVPGSQGASSLQPLLTICTILYSSDSTVPLPKWKCKSGSGALQSYFHCSTISTVYIYCNFYPLHLNMAETKTCFLFSGNWRVCKNFLEPTPKFFPEVLPHPSDRSSCYLHGGWPEQGPLGLRIPNFPQDAQKVLPDVGVEDPTDRGFDQMFPSCFGFPRSVQQLPQSFH